MKLFLALVLATAAAASFAADSFARADVSAIDKDAKIKLTPMAGQDYCKMEKQNWGDAATRDYRFSAARGTKLSNEWTSVKFAFKAEETGRIFLQFGGQWAQSEANRGWLAISDIKVNGKLIPNGDFSKFTTEKNGKVKLANFWLGNKARHDAKGGPDGQGACIINHDNRVNMGFSVEAGKEYVVEYQVKAVPAPAK